MKFQKNRGTSLVLIVIFLILAICRFVEWPENMLTWDVFGYYLYLPARFIYNDIGLTDQSWLNNIMEQYQPSSTFYQIVWVESNNWVIKYSMGQAILYAPFFFIAHLFASPLGFPADGFSFPYQLSVTIGALIYTFVGLIYLSKVLRTYFSDKLTSILLVIIVFGTNYFHLIAFDGTLLSHNFLFTLYAILVFYTIKWHDKPGIGYAIAIGISLGFITLIRPSEIVAVSIPLFWQIWNKESLLNKLRLVRANWPHLMIMTICFILPLIPQALYWKSITGTYFFYSYNNPGEGFELLYPYTLKFLFSFRKGWFIYTPVMIFAIIGLYHLYKSNRPVMLAVVVFLVADIYLISSWSCWWYAGGSFSSRALVPAYVVLALPLGYFLKSLQYISKGARIIIHGSIFFFILLNLFQTWQFKQGIIDKERMTLKYYFATFGKVKVDESDRKLLLVERYTESDEYFVNDGSYKHKTIYYNKFEGLYNDSSDVFIMDKDHPFSPGLNLQYKQITGKDHFWVRARASVFIPEGYTEDMPLLIISFHHKGKPYKYRGKGVISGEIRYNDWNELGFDYLSPEVRSLRDNLKVYIWHRGTDQIQVDGLRVDVYEPLN